MKLLATDLDKTLIPNGKAKYDGSIPLFKKLTKKFTLVYITGRNLELTKQAIKKYKIPQPEYMITDVGTRILSKNGRELQSWNNYIKKNTKKWNTKTFQKKLKGILGLYLQEKENQNEFKLSYYVNDPVFIEKIAKKVKERLKNTCVVYSVDIDREIGFIDILPKCTGKLGALEFIRKKLKVSSDDVVFCGDSGNDVSLLAYVYKSIIVKNASKNVIDFVLSKKSKNVYVAKGSKELNGNYSSGILEGLKFFGWVKFL